MPSIPTAAAVAEGVKQRQSVFQQLRPICSQLLFKRTDAAAMHKELAALQVVVQGVDLAGLLACWDYLAFPLLLITDSVRPARPLASKQQQQQQQQWGLEEGGEVPGEAEVAVPAAKSDRVTEAALGCLLALFERCGHGAEEDQAWASLQRLAPLLMLPQEAASEEVRCLAFRCVLALLAPSPLTAAGSEPRAQQHTQPPPSPAAACTLSSHPPPTQQQQQQQPSAQVEDSGDFDVDALLLSSPADILAEEEHAIGPGKPPIFGLHSTVHHSGGPAHPGSSTAHSMHSSTHSMHSSRCELMGKDTGPLAVQVPPLSRALSAEPAAPFLGYLVHACLAASEVEIAVGGGAGGSRALRLVALQLLRRLMQVVSDWQALAFYLPGVASSLAKQIYASTGGLPKVSATAGSGSGSKATALAVSCLTDIVAITLSNAAHAPTLVIAGIRPDAPESSSLASMGQHGGQGELGVGPVDYDAQAALKALQDLASPTTSTAAAGGHKNGQLGPSSLSGVSQTKGPHGTGAAGAAARTAVGDRIGRNGGGGKQGGERLLRVECDEAWLKGSSVRVVGLLQKALPPLCNHPRPSVREALAAGAVQLLQCCSQTLGTDGCNMLLELVLVLAQDEWPRVSQPCVAWLAGQHQPQLKQESTQSHTHAEGSMQSASAQQQMPRGKSLDAALVAGPAGRPGSAGMLPGAMLDQLVEGLLPAVKAGEAQGTLQARKLSTALLYAGACGCSVQLLQRPLRLTQILEALAACFTFDQATAPLALHMRVADGGGRHHHHHHHSHLHRPPSCHPRSNPQGGTSSGGIPAAADSVGGANSASATQTEPNKTHASQSSPSIPASSQPLSSSAYAPDAKASCVLLPRMPLCTLHLGSVRCYEAVAGVARSLGHLARMADAMAVAGSRTHLRRLCDQLAQQLRSAADQAASHQLTGPPSARAGKSRQSRGGPAGMATTNSPTHAASRALTTVGSISWQAAAASAAAVASEVMLGASAAWQPAFSAPDARGISKPQGPDPGFEQSVQLVLGQVVCEELWGAPTHNPGSILQQQQQQQGAGRGGMGWPDVDAADGHGVPEKAPWLSAQVLGQNALLARALAECCGAAARALGPRLSTLGRLLRCVLLPLLERLADPCPLAAQSAGVALDSVCMHCGYGGSLRNLLNANADYVVDALCGQLRDLGAHPRAPLLLAALLRRAGGVAPHMLPLMAEPLQAALRGLSIIARRQQPHYTHAFLAASVEIAAGAADEAVDAAALSHAATGDMRDRVERVAQQRRQAAESAAAAVEARHRGDSASRLPTSTSAQAYFTQRVRRQKAAQETSFSVAPPTADDEEGLAAEAEIAAEEGYGEGEEEEEEAGEWRHRIMGAQELEALEVRGRRLRSAATAAAAAADAAAPLLTSSDLRVCLAAMQCARTALEALHHSTPALAADQQLMEDCGPRGVTRPTPPDPPKLLPTIALMWPHTMAALADARTPVVEGALQLVASLTCLGGGAFMARRFRSEAALLLSRLLVSGTAYRPPPLTSVPSHHQSLAQIGSANSTAGGWAPSGLLLSSTEGTRSGTSGGSGGQGAADGRDRRDVEVQRGGALAPGALVRVRVAVLQCLGCVCGSSEARGAVKGMAWGIAEACLPFLSASHPLPLQQAASDALRAVAQADEDAVWLLLTDVVYNSSSSSSSSCSSRPGTHTPKSGLQSSSPCITVLPDKAQSHAPLPAQQQQQQQQQQPEQPRNTTDTTADPAMVHLLAHGEPPPPPRPSFPPFQTILSLLPKQGSHSASPKLSSSEPPLPPSFSLASPSAPWVVTPALALECGPRARTLLACLGGSGSSGDPGGQESTGVDGVPGCKESAGVAGNPSSKESEAVNGDSGGKSSAGVNDPGCKGAGLHGTEGAKEQASELHVPLPSPLAVLVGLS